MSAAIAPANDDESSRYEFDDDFQSKIVAMALRDTTFVSRTEGLLLPAYLENEADAAILKVALDHYQIYKKAPDKGSIGLLLKNAIVAKTVRSDLIDQVKDRVKIALLSDISDRDLVIDEVSKFARHQAMTGAIMKSVHLLEKGDFTGIEKAIRGAVDVGVVDEEGDYDYWQEILNRTEERIALAAGTIKPDGISTGSAELDKYLYHSGWGRKELSVIMGAAKAGKSMSLGEFGKCASLLGYNVFYASCEVRAKIIADRTDANIADHAIRLLKDAPHAVKAKIQAASARAGIYKMREYPSGMLKVSQLRRELQRYRNKGIIFDLVIVDYADIMAPERYTGDLKDDMRQIYIDLRGVAFEWNCAVLTATQTNREGAKSAVAKMTDIAEDFNKVRTADILISINATEPERQAGEARLYFAASRNSESGFILRIKQDREKMKFLTKILGKEMP